jgi:excisionase family DNA binding protein
MEVLADRVLLSVDDVALALGITRDGARRLIVDGVIPHVRLSPRRVRVPRAALEAWLQAQAERALETCRFVDEEVTTKPTP